MFRTNLYASCLERQIGSYLLERVGQRLVAVQIVMNDVWGEQARGSLNVASRLCDSINSVLLKLTGSDDSLCLTHDVFVRRHAEIAGSLKQKNKVDTFISDTSRQTTSCSHSQPLPLNHKPATAKKTDELLQAEC